MLTSIEPGVAKDMKITASDKIEELLSKVDFKDKDVYIIPYGGNVVPLLEEN